MARARLLKSLIKPVMERHPNLVFFDNTPLFPADRLVPKRLHLWPVKLDGRVFEICSL